MTSWQIRSGAREILEAVLAEVAQGDAGRQRALGQGARRAGERTWPPWPAAAMRAARWTSSPT